MTILGNVSFYRDNEVNCFELKVCASGDLSFIRHSHDEYSLGLVESGTSSLWCEGSKAAIAPGTLVFIPAGAVHVCSPHKTNNWRFKMLYLDADWVRKVWQNEKSLAINFPLVTEGLLNRHSFATIGQLFDNLSCTTNPLEKEEQLLTLLYRTLKGAGGMKTAGDKQAQARIKRVREYLSSCFLEKVTLEKLEEVSGLDKCHIIRSFKASYNLSPHTYLTLLRVNYSKRELRKQRQIAQVAQDAGFYDQSHFVKMFKKYVGVTPRKYQNLC